MTFRYELATFLPFQDLEASQGAGAITRQDIENHTNPNFQIRVKEEPDTFSHVFANDVVDRIRTVRDEGCDLGVKHRSFRLDGYLGGEASRRRFIARLVAHGPVSEFVPGSILQETRTDSTTCGPVAENVEIDMA